MTEAFSQIPVWILALGGGILGAIFGSFIGALCSRWPQGISVVFGRSACDSCNHRLSAVELIPIISYIIQRGKCRDCNAPIGAMQWVAELTAATIGSVAFMVYTIPQATNLALMGWLILPLIILDHRHLWLPDRLTILLGITGLISGILLLPDYDPLFHIIAALLGFGALEALRRGYKAYRRREGMGAGDPKMFAALALWLPWQMLPMMLVGATGMGIIWLLIMGHQEKLDEIRLPLGSLMGVSAFILYAWH